MPALRLRSCLLVALQVALLACGREGNPRDAAGARSDTRAHAAVRWMRDDLGDSVAIPARPVRVVSLNPTTTEILFAIGAGARLVGRSQWDVWPDSARLVPDLGPGIRPNLEAVLGAHPDLVLLYASADDRPAAQRLRAAGIAALSFRIDRIDDFRRVTRLLGALTGDSARAANVVDSVDRSLDAVRAATRSLPTRTVFIRTWERPLMTIGGGSFMSELVAIAGGRNVYDSLPAPSPTVTLEDVVRRDPDVVLVSPTDEARLRHDASWRVLRAVREGHVLAYDTSLVARPSVVMGMAARSLARLLHPGAVD